MKKIKEHWKQYLVIIIAAMVVCIPLLKSNLNLGIDDGIQHICRLIGTKQAIEQGTGTIMSNLCNNFGYSWTIFYSPLTAYIPMIFALFTSSYVAMLKLFIFVVSIATGLTMYRLVRKITDNKIIAVISAIIYIFTPYRLTDMYIRVAIAELTSFVFLPLIFLGLYNILKGTQKKGLDMDLIIGATGLLLTHTVITLYTAIFCLIYICIELISKRRKDKKEIKTIISKMAISAIIVVLLTAFYTVPMILHKLNTEYEVFRSGRMLRVEALIDNKVNATTLFLDNTYMVYCLGIVLVLGLLITPFAIKKIAGEKYDKLYYFSLISGLVSILMSLDIFPFEKLPSVFTMLQFSFRMLEFSSFFLTIVVAINYGKVVRKIKYIDIIFVITILILSTIPLRTHLCYEKINEEKLEKGIQVTAQTGRVHAGCATFEYLPTKAFKNRNYIETREDKVYVLEGNVEVLNEDKKATNLYFEIKGNGENCTLELPYIYYLGYEVTVIEDDGTKKTIKPEESEKGFLQIKISNIESAKIMVRYKGVANWRYICLFIGIMIILAKSGCINPKNVIKYIGRKEIKRKEKS